MTELVVPQGRLRQSRIAPDVRTVLVEALDRSFTGYAIVAPKRAAGVKSVFTFEAGVLALVYHPDADAGGERALTALEDVGPCRIDLYELSVEQLQSAHDDRLSVSPALPATYLTGDRALAARTRKRAAQIADTDSDAEPAIPDGDHDAIEAFLDDTERIETLQEQARMEARRRAEEWGFGELLAETGENVLATERDRNDV